MLKSMTGFGHFEITEQDVTISVEIRTVNHRYCDVYLRMPKQLSTFEEGVRSILTSRITRGKVDAFVTLDNKTVAKQQVVLDETLAASYHQALKKMVDEFGLRDDISATALARFPDILRIEKQEDDTDWEGILQKAITGAVTHLMEMRGREGEKLGESLLNNLDYIESQMTHIAAVAPRVVQEYRERLENRIQDLLDPQKLDQQRLAMEVAVFADKCSIDEELVRLRSHIGQMRSMLQEGSPVGKKLDFLIQEMNREVNTIGSKASNLDITKVVVSLKSEIEKMREQVQNVE